MNRILLQVTYFLIFSASVFSQDNKCNCLNNLNMTIEKTTENYAGFPQKINAKTKKEYNSLVKTLIKKAGFETSPKKCFNIIKDYVVFFKDKHFDFSYLTSDDDKEFSKITEAYFIKTFKLRDLSRVEGIWINPDSSLKIAIRQTSKNIFKAVIVKSKDEKLKPGLVYFTLFKDAKGYSYIRHNVLTTGYPARQNGHLLQLWNTELWGKEYPEQMTPKEKNELATWRNYNFGLAFTKINDKTTYIKIPTFNRDDLVQQLINKNDTAIRSCENLIVDLRGNGGGNTGWSYLLPYLITNPINQEYSYLRISPDNIKSSLAEMEPIVNNPVSEDMKKYFTPAFMLEYKNAYNDISKSKLQFYPIPSITIPVDSISKNPKRIALVFDELCGSSTEYFFHISKQSTKTIRYGTNTLGMMDYVGMHTPTKLPCKKYNLVIPDKKSSWTDIKPIDTTGFKPEIDLSKLPKDNWINYIIKDLGRM